MSAAHVTAPSPAFASASTVMGNRLDFAAVTAAHVIERELTRPVPRTVRYTREARCRFQWAINGCVGVVLLLIWIGSRGTTGASPFYQLAYFGAALFGVPTAVALYNRWQESKESHKWLASGEAVAGVVTERKRSLTDPSPGADCTLVFEFFQPSDRRILRQYITVSGAEYRTFPPGTVVTLVLHPHIRDMVRPYFKFNAVEVV